MFWGYLHHVGKIIVKRWFGDERDYTSDCRNNQFVIAVVEPFRASSIDEASDIIHKRLSLVMAAWDCLESNGGPAKSGYVLVTTEAFTKLQAAIAEGRP